MKYNNRGQIVIECPNTIFQLYIDSEEEFSKIQVFMNNLRHVDSLGVNDIYNWCNRQCIDYSTSFNYGKSKGRAITDIIRAYFLYCRHKIKYRSNYINIEQSRQVL